MTKGRRATWTDIETRLILDPVTGCRNWSGRPLSDNGYGLVRYHQRLWRVHILVWTHHNGSAPEGLQVLHTCDNRVCGEISHLFLGTQQVNMDDMVAKGRQAVGERHGSARLTYRQVQAIIFLYCVLGCSQRHLARRFEVAHSQISRILAGDGWVN
jgi:hypothetical protein